MCPCRSVAWPYSKAAPARVYHFMFAPGVEGWPNASCSGGSMFVDQIGHAAHFHARDVSLALVSRAPRANIEPYRRRMGWTLRGTPPPTTPSMSTSVARRAKAKCSGLSVFLCDRDDVYRAYFTSDRGVEALGSVWTFLDLTPYGRQEEWEDAPPGWPQTAPYEWWRTHDEY